MSKRITVDLSRDIYALSKIMEFDRVLRVHTDGTVSHPTDVHAPEVHLDTGDDGQILDEHEEAMIKYIKDQGWSLMRGWSGAYLAGDSPIMHESEFIGGHLAEEILETAEQEDDVDYVALVVEVDSEVCPNESDTCTLSDPCVLCYDDTGEQREREAAGWLIAYREVTGS